MKICLIAEGSYPYVTGGVSSWINQLVLNIPEHEFQVIAITPDSSKRAQYKYKLPANLTLLHDVFLDELSNHGRQRRRRFNMTAEEANVVRGFLIGRVPDWQSLFTVFRNWGESGVQAMDILMSKDYFDLVRELGETKYAQLSFTQVYWTLHSMFLLVFSLLLLNYPPAGIYHAVSTGYAGIVGAFAAYSHSAGYILTEHGIYTREREEEIIKADWVHGFLKNIWIDYFKILSDCAYANASQVITLFERNSEIQKELGCPSEKTRVIHNGIKPNQFEPIAMAIRERTQRQEIKIGAIIRVVPVKDIKSMLLAFSIVSRKLPQASFYIMGPTEEDPDYFQECQHYKDYLNLHNAVFTGTVDIRSYLKDMDLLVLTSISEGQPLAILEGLASTLPFVATDVGDCRMMITGQHDSFGPAGRVVPIMDVTAIAEAILDLAENETMRRHMGEAGSQRVQAFYAFDDFISSYREIYQKGDWGYI
ncbi:MAG: GT4 family glycosyltransferase PelF [Ruminococcaceae bacterium]|nr:GT4 family glycosyltransferase PelF [Oscillospiraceae bacterium]